MTKIFFEQEKLFLGRDLVEGVNVSLANFADICIDYPNAKEYAFQMFDSLESLNLLTSENVFKYR